MPKSKSQSEGSDLVPKMVEQINNAVFSANIHINMSIYAILELPQELYFGSHSEKNLNIVEKVSLRAEVKTGNDVKAVMVDKGYYSPTKQRGIERRAIAYSLVKTKDNVLVPYYKHFNLSIDITDTYLNGVPDPRDILTFVWGGSWRSPASYIRGRVGYGGGVAVQDNISIRQRNRVSYDAYAKTEKEDKNEVSEQTLWKKEYIEPGVLIPVIRHGFMLGWENYEPHALAYAFLEGLKIAGAGTPKSIDIFDGFWLKQSDNEEQNNSEKQSVNERQKAVVVDLYSWLSPDPVVISPAITSVIEALEEFERKALSYKKECEECVINNAEQINVEDILNKVKEGKAVRLVGNIAYAFLRALANKFGTEYLGNIDQLSIPRIGFFKNVPNNSSKQ